MICLLNGKRVTTTNHTDIGLFDQGVHQQLKALLML